MLGPELLGPTGIVTTCLLWMAAVLPTLFRERKAAKITPLGNTLQNETNPQTVKELTKKQVQFT